MELPSVTDGTIRLRPAQEDADRGLLTDWLAGPASPQRSQTDGGPLVDRADATGVIRRWQGSDYVAIAELDGEPCGAVHLSGTRDRMQLQVVVSQPALWHQGIGGRMIDLAVHLAFAELGVAELQVVHLREDAAPARLAYEHAGFGQEQRVLRDGLVYGEWTLAKVAHDSQEQRVFLICAGESNRAESRVLTGWDDPALSALGRAQAESLASGGLLSSVVEGVTSDLRRARATAERALVTRQVPVTRDESWRGQDVGTLAGKSYESLAAGFEQAPPDGETLETYQRRLLLALNSLPRGGDVAVVTHNDAIALIMRSLHPGLADAPGLGSGRGIGHGSISELRRGVGGWRVIRVADDRHLIARAATVDLL